MNIGRLSERHVFDAEAEPQPEPPSNRIEIRMSDNVYRVTEIVGSSTTSSDDAIRTALSRAAETLHNIDWFQVVETRGHVENGEIAHFQVTVKIGFKLED
jgi:flavin-binding protein dodecin